MIWGYTPVLGNHLHILAIGTGRSLWFCQRVFWNQGRFFVATLPLTPWQMVWLLSNCCQWRYNFGCQTDFPAGSSRYKKGQAQVNPNCDVEIWTILKVRLDSALRSYLGGLPGLLNVPGYRQPAPQRMEFPVETNTSADVSTADIHGILMAKLEHMEVSSY